MWIDVSYVALLQKFVIRAEITFGMYQTWNIWEIIPNPIDDNEKLERGISKLDNNSKNVHGIIKNNRVAENNFFNENKLLQPRMREKTMYH